MGRGILIPFVNGIVTALVAIAVGFDIADWQFWMVGALGLGAYFMGIFRVTKGGWYD